MWRGELSFGDDIELRMIMADSDMKDGYVYEQHEHFYTLTSTASRSFRRFFAEFSSISFLIGSLTLYFHLISLKCY